MTRITSSIPRIDPKLFVWEVQTPARALYNAWLQLQDVLPPSIHNLEDIFYKEGDTDPTEEDIYSYGFVRRSAIGNFRLVMYGELQQINKFEFICEAGDGHAEQIFNFYTADDLGEEAIQSFGIWERITSL